MSEVCHDVSTETSLQPLGGDLSPYVQLTKMLVLAWTSRLLDAGVLGLNLLFLMLEYLTFMPLQTVVIPIANMKL